MELREEYFSDVYFGFCHIRDVSRIRKHLGFGSAKSLTGVPVLSRLDYFSEVPYTASSYARSQPVGETLLARAPKSVRPLVMSAHKL